MKTNNNHYDAIIIGAGPAGLTSAIYLSRAKLKVLVINEGIVGGQMILTHEIVNYPGIEKISGYELSEIMKKQAIVFGSNILSGVSIKNLSLHVKIKKIELYNGSIYTAKSIILAPGGRSKLIGAENEEKFRGRGISYCATCDGDFFRDKNIIVVGGGNSAIEEAISLTKYAKKVTIVHRGSNLNALKHGIEQAQRNNKIDFMFNSEIVSFFGKDNLENVVIKNNITKKSSTHKIDGVFILIGYLPNTEFLNREVLLNTKDEIITDNRMLTNIEGVFAAGDSIEKKYRQITTAVSDGTIAALSLLDYLDSKK